MMPTAAQSGMDSAADLRGGALPVSGGLVSGYSLDASDETSSETSVTEAVTQAFLSTVKPQWPSLGTGISEPQSGSSLAGFNMTMEDIVRGFTDNTTGALNPNDTMRTIPMGSLVSLNYNLPVMIIVAAILFVVIVATAFGNFLVGLSLFRYRYLRTVSNFLIGNLALSDFLLATTILPLSTINECLGHWVLGQVMCNFWLLADVLYCTASIWNLCVIAFDRFTATLYPVWYREKRSTKQAAIYVTAVWVLSTIVCMPPLLGWNDLSLNYIYNNQTNVYQCVPFQTTSYVVYSASGSFFIPFFITFFFYVRIFTVLRRRMKKMRNSNKLHQARNSTNNKASVNAKPLLNSAVRIESTEMTTTEVTGNTVTCTNDGSGNTEELSSKSLFGSDSGAENPSEDEEEDDSSTQIKSDNPLYQSSCSEAERTPRTILKNGLKKDVSSRKCGIAEKNMVILNPHHQLSESEKDSEGQEKVRIIITEDEVMGKDSDSDAQKHLSCPKNPTKQSLIPKTSGSASVGSSGGKSPSKKSNFTNPFKQQKKKSHSSQRRKFEQREMRATIRMAIIIGVFCGMWVGFFTTYVIRGFCPDCFIPRELDAFFFWLGYSNSSVNPILYTIFNEEFRKAFQKILGCYRKNNRGGQRH